MGFWVGTLIFALFELLGFGAVQATGGKRKNNLLPHTLWATAVICCWLMWTVVYVAQMHPLVHPVLQG